jgi:hypothetical protein
VGLGAADGPADHDEGGGEVQVELHDDLPLLGTARSLPWPFIYEWVRSTGQPFAGLDRRGTPLTAIRA